MKSAFDGLINRPDRDEERIDVLEKRWIENSKTEMLKGKNFKGLHRIWKHCGKKEQRERK